MSGISVIFDEPAATELDTLRRQRRRGKDITYDCQNSVVMPEMRVTCRKGRPLNANSYDGGLNLASILKGYTSGSCKSCPDYRPGDPE